MVPPSDDLAGQEIVLLKGCREKMAPSPRLGYMCPMRAQSWMRPLLVGLGILAASVPLGMFVAILLFPFWGWLEERTGIESVGHSGPAEWCFLVSMAACALLLGLALFPLGREPRG